MINEQAAKPDIDPEMIADARVAIVASKYNQKHVQSMIDAAEETLKAHGLQAHIYRVPGAFEIPCIVQALANSEGFDAIIALGLVIEGETEHARLITESVTQQLARIQVDKEIPISHGVLLVHNLEQADKRCLDPKHNRGKEVATTTLEMISLINPLMEEIQDQIFKDMAEIDMLNEEIDDEA